MTHLTNISSPNPMTQGTHTLKNLVRVNLITGTNGCGKTTLLRTILSQSPAAILLPAPGDGLIARLASEARLLGNLEALNLLGILGAIEPRLWGLFVGARGNITADIGLGVDMPIEMMGDGINRVLAIVLAIAAHPGGIILIDGIENSLHHSALTPLWETIAALTDRYDAQLFATTQSFECIESAAQAMAEDVALYRLDERRVVRYDAGTLLYAASGPTEVRFDALRSSV